MDQRFAYMDLRECRRTRSVATGYCKQWTGIAKAKVLPPDRGLNNGWWINVHLVTMGKLADWWALTEIRAGVSVTAWQLRQRPCS